jgi:hypothetical protein
MVTSSLKVGSEQEHPHVHIGRIGQAGRMYVIVSGPWLSPTDRLHLHNLAGFKHQSFPKKQLFR